MTISLLALAEECITDDKFQFRDVSDLKAQIRNVFDTYGRLTIGGHKVLRKTSELSFLRHEAQFSTDPVRKLIAQNLISRTKNGVTEALSDFIEKPEPCRPYDIEVLTHDGEEELKNPEFPPPNLGLPPEQVSPTDAPLDDEAPKDVDLLAKWKAKKQVKFDLSQANLHPWPENLKSLDELPDYIKSILWRIISLDVNYPTEVDEAVEELGTLEGSAAQIIFNLQQKRVFSNHTKMLLNGERWGIPFDDFKAFRPHQTTLAWLALNFKRVLDASDMGVGKLLGAACVTAVVDYANVVVVIKPNREVQDKALAQYRDIYQHQIAAGEVQIFDSIRDAYRKLEANGVISPAPRIIVIDRVSQFQNSKGYAQQFLQRVDGVVDLLVLDEAHTVKGSDSKRTAAIRALANASNRILLQTGTPLMSSVEDTRQILASLYESIPESHGYFNLELGKKSKFKPNLAHIMQTGDALAPVMLRVMNPQPLTPAEIHTINEEGDHLLNTLVTERLISRYSQQKQVTMTDIEWCFNPLKVPAAVELAKEEAEKGGISMVSVGPHNGEVMEAYSSALKAAGLRVLEFHGQVDGNDIVDKRTGKVFDLSERKKVIQAVQTQQVDVVLCNKTASTGTDGFQGVANKPELPGRVTLFIEAVSHPTPAERDQHYRRVERIQECGELVFCRFVRLEAWVELTGKKGNSRMSSYDEYRQSRLRERDMLFEAIINGELSNEMMVGENKKLINESDEAREYLEIIKEAIKA